MRKLILNVLIMAVVIPMKAQSTGGELNFSFTSLPNGATFSPKHVLAVWIEAENGNFVKTLKLRADKRKQYLYTWNASSGGNTTDAITGATMSNHETHNLTWDITDVNATVVADGNYKIIAEYTSEHAQGPLLSVSFTKAAEELTLSPSDETYFESISLNYVPDALGLNDIHVIQDVGIYPNPATDHLNIRMTIAGQSNLSISVYDASMRKLSELFNNEVNAGEFSQNFNIDREKYQEGVYFIVISTGKNIYARKLILAK